MTATNYNSNVSIAKTQLNNKAVEAVATETKIESLISKLQALSPRHASYVPYKTQGPQNTNRGQNRG